MNEGGQKTGKADRCRGELSGLPDAEAWIAYLREHSDLPGPRANLELLYAFGDTAPERLILRLAWLAPETSVPNTPDEFLLVCGTAGLGRLLTSGDRAGDGEAQAGVLVRLRELASDDRWRVREAVAMALQRLGRSDYSRLVSVASDWAGGNPLEQRAAIAALSEPDLLRAPDCVAIALAILRAVTVRLSYTPAAGRKADGFRVLRQALAYCWSVVMAADMAAGRPAFESWLKTDDKDVRWVMLHNLGKRRLIVADPVWVESMRARLEAGPQGGTR